MGALAALASLGVLVMMLHICADIVLRTFFDAPVPATVEIVSRYYMVLIAFLPLAWIEQRNAMVSVEITDAALSPRMLRISDVLVSLLVTCVYAVLAYTTWRMALREWATGTYVLALETRVPVWPTYFLPPLGFGLAAFATLLRAATQASGKPIADEGAAS